MRTEGHMASYAIQNHCSLVLAIDKKELFTRLYNYSWNILRRQDRLSYEYVMNNLIFPQDWRILIRRNPHLDSFYRGSSAYHPPMRGPGAGMQVLKFKRNTYSHSLEHSIDMATMQQFL
jgi:hypothetical protein